MDNQQAKLILSIYRPTGKDATDPFFAEALDQVRHDPELSRWFADQRRFDQTLHSALQTINAPPPLRDSVLLHRKVVQMKVPPPAARRAKFPSSWVAIAASLVLLLGIGLLWKSGPSVSPNMSTLQFVDAIHDMNDADKLTLGKMAANTQDLREWLAAQGAPHDFPLPASLQNLAGVGCQSFVINGAKISLLCFMADNRQLVHLFVVDDGVLSNPPGDLPIIQRQGQTVAAIWSAAGRTFLLTGTNLTEETLQRLI